MDSQSARASVSRASSNGPIAATDKASRGLADQKGGIRDSVQERLNKKYRNH